MGLSNTEQVGGKGRETGKIAHVAVCSHKRQARKRHLVVTAARLIEEQLQDVPRVRRIFVTLTYASAGDWTPLDVTTYLDHVRGWTEARGMGYAAVWVAERGKLRGRLHLHVCVWIWRKDGRRPKNLPMPDRAGQWRKGMSNITELRNPVGYMAKYVSKANPQGFAFPHGMRLCGVRGLRGPELLELRWWRCPPWIRKFVPMEDGIRRLRYGWWGNRATKWAYRSPWRWDADTWRANWAGWGWHDVCMTGEIYAEYSGSG